MAKKKNIKLVIVESPSKAKTISQYLGNDFIVESSYGHIRDLPTSVLGIDVANNFEPKYKIITKAKERAIHLAKLAKGSSEVILATDPDREGEAIAWHLVNAINTINKKGNKKNKALDEKSVKRIVFHEITKTAIEEAIASPRAIDMNLVDAQQARRILDRLVGYKLSPFLWKKILRGLSAGRVQSVALRFIVQKEKERDAFHPEQYFTVSTLLQKVGARKEENQLEADLVKINGATIEKPGLRKKEEVAVILDDLKKGKFVIKDVVETETTREPSAPFTTSTLQQEAFSKLGMTAKSTMMTAQELYQGVTLGGETIGLITYMRTDSLNLSEDSIARAGDFIISQFGATYHAPKRYKTKSKSAQEAHEAIRPTDSKRTPESIREQVSPRQFKLYSLIWKRFMASQMTVAKFNSTKVTIEVEKEKVYTFASSGITVQFDGFLRVFPDSQKEITLPPLVKGEELELVKLESEEKFTQASARYSEASLIKILEKYGIGRPSTYAPTISTIQERRYVEKDEAKRLKPTKIGILVNDLLEAHFPKIVDYEFTAKMEEELDEIAEGKKNWRDVIRNFYIPFEENLVKKYDEVGKIDVGNNQKTDEVCEKCGKPMVVKYGRFGEFLSCSDFPKCRNAKTILVSTGITCPKCSLAEIIERKTKKRNKVFYGCASYPKCDFALWNKPTGEKCPKCSAPLVEYGKKTVKCSSKECGYKVGAPQEDEE